MQRLSPAGLAVAVVMTAMQFAAAEPADAFTVHIGRMHQHRYAQVVPGYTYVNPGYTYANPGYTYLNPGRTYINRGYNRGFGQRRGFGRR